MGRSRGTGKRGGGSENSLIKRLVRGLGSLFKDFSVSYLKDNPKNAIWIVPALLAAILVLPLLISSVFVSGFAALFRASPILGGILSLGGLFAITVVGYVQYNRARGHSMNYCQGVGQVLLPVVSVVQLLATTSVVSQYAGRLSNFAADGSPDSTAGTGKFILPLSEKFHSELDETGGIFSGISNEVTLERNNSMLVLGESGSGKTTTIELLMHQMNSSSHEPIIIFDFKGEFGETEIFSNRDIKVVSVRDADWNRNVFREARTEDDYQEISTKLIDTSEDSGRNEFFTDSARRILTASLIYLDRENTEPTNRELVQFFTQTQGEIYNALSEYDDLRTAAEQLGGPDDKTGKDVLSTLRPFIDKVFTGAFAEVGGFSVRDYMENPRGNVLVVQATMSQFERTKPGLKFLIDWAIQLGLDDGSRNAYFVLDEFQRLPKLDNIELLVNAGRSKKSQAILGVQGVTQLESSYGTELAQAITAGTTQKVMMRPGDKTTTELIMNSIGSVIVEHREDTDGWGKKKTTQEEQQYLSERDIQQFQPGETVIRVPDGFVHGRVKPWEHLSNRRKQQLQSN